MNGRGFPNEGTWQPWINVSAECGDSRGPDQPWHPAKLGHTLDPIHSLSIIMPTFFVSVSSLAERAKPQSQCCGSGSESTAKPSSQLPSAGRKADFRATKPLASGCMQECFRHSALNFQSDFSMLNVALAFRNFSSIPAVAESC